MGYKTRRVLLSFDWSRKVAGGLGLRPTGIRSGDLVEFVATNPPTEEGLRDAQRAWRDAVDRRDAAYRAARGEAVDKRVDPEVLRWEEVAVEVDEAVKASMTEEMPPTRAAAPAQLAR